jgi:hypothetical protein
MLTGPPDDAVADEKKGDTKEVAGTPSPSPAKTGSTTAAVATTPSPTSTKGASVTAESSKRPSKKGPPPGLSTTPTPASTAGKTSSKKSEPITGATATATATPVVLSEAEKAEAKRKADDAVSAGLAKAVAHKDKLIRYGQRAGERAQVIDDQSDYYEFESNVWLSEEQKKEKEIKAKQIEQALHHRG